ncbi:UNVERIFIED_CONTAM: hypothetical protein Slati_0888100 [Sesamum latifolium]|uniref:Reverse transcriptase domain-containing protein n=1 Tax=Sesamum latifolium TaxID=2727402 RepID=A0AAW2XQR9_9LAMI
MQGEWFTWHNCSRDARSLWKRLDRILVNDNWLGAGRTHFILVLPPGLQTTPLLCYEGTPLLVLADLACSGPLNPVLLHLEYCCRLVMRLASKLEQNMLHQRAKLAWLKGGDQCSRIFFRKVASRRASKRVFQIRNEVGETLTDQQDVVNEFVSFYRSLLGGEQRARSIDLGYLRPWARRIISEEEGRHLIRSVTPVEVKQAIFDIDETKAPGPDGYSLGFFKAAWPIVGSEVTQAILEFFANGKLLKQVNATLLSLIPKELFTGYNRQHLPPRCALKVDIRKAYDTVEWDFLRRGARGLRQGIQCPHTSLFWLWRSLISSYSKSLHRMEGFPIIGGVRQSTYFSLGLQMICSCLAELMRARFISLSVASLSLLTSLVFTLIRRRATSFYLFCIWETLLSILDYQEGVLPLWYLGLPLLASRLTIADCTPLLLKIDSRIKGWDGIMLSFAGRVQLIKSVLLALQMYWAMAFILPKGIIREIEKRLRSFLWKGTMGVGYAKVSWHQILCVGGMDFSLPPSYHSVWTVSDSTGSWGWKKLVRLRNTLRQFIEYRIGSGASFLLWHDPWHEMGPLITRFPSALSTRIPILWRSSVRGGTFSSAAAYDMFHPPGPKTATLETHEHLFFLCPFATTCLREVQRLVRFHWPYRDWDTAVQWASGRWRSKHVVHASFRALLASLVYHVWQERNCRIFQHTLRDPLDIARHTVNDIRDLIISKDLPHSVSTRGLYRLPWPVEGDATL